MGSLVPALGIAGALGVVAVIALLAARHRESRTESNRAATRPATATAPAGVRSPATLDPRGGMRGMVLIEGAFATPSGRTLISFDRCQPCGAGGDGRHARSGSWLATETGRGATWRVAPRPWNFNLLAFAGADGWAEGVQSDSHSAGGVVRFYSSHNDGRTWTEASSAAPAPGYGGVSIAGGEVWSLGCRGAGCRDTVVHGSASSDQLAATAAQPPIGNATNVAVAAATSDTAYIGTADYTHPTRSYATRDGGRSWRAIASPCPRAGYSNLYASGPLTLWATCEPHHGSTELRRSADGGRRWNTLPALREDLAALRPASPHVAWALTTTGRVIRTADSGQTWTTAWYGGRPEPSILGGQSPILATQNATTATVVAVVTHGRVDGHARFTNFVTYRTTDGGRHWRPSVVRLPPG